MIFSCTDVDALTNCRSEILGFLRWGFLRFYLFVILLFKLSCISLVSEQTSILIVVCRFSPSHYLPSVKKKTERERERNLRHKEKTECICSTLTAINSDSDQITWPAPAPFTLTSLLQSLVIPPPPLQTTIAGCICYSSLQPFALKYPHHYFSHQHYPPVNSRPSLLKSSPYKSNKPWTSFSFNPAQTRK